MLDDRRVRRLSKQIQRYVASIIDEELSLPTMVSVTHVSCDPSFAKARVNVSVYGCDDVVREVMEELVASVWFIRKELSRRTKMRHTPDLVFVNDTSGRDGQAMIDLIDSLSGTSQNARN